MVKKLENLLRECTTVQNNRSSDQAMVILLPLNRYGIPNPCCKKVFSQKKLELKVLNNDFIWFPNIENLQKRSLNINF